MFIIICGIDGMLLVLFIEMMLLFNMEGGGLVNVLVGSGLLILWVMVFGMLLGIMVGIYLVEYGCKFWLVEVICFINDILFFVLLIVVGLFVYIIVVVQMEYFFGWVGVIVLVLLQVLIVICIIENMLKLVLDSLCEVVYVLGILKWKMIFVIMLKVLVFGIMIGILLVIVCIVGEIVLLLFIVFFNQFWSMDMMQLIVNLLVMIFKFVMSLFVEWQ